MKRNIINVLTIAFVLTIFTQNSFSQNVDQKTRLITELTEISFSAFPAGYFENNVEKAKIKTISDFKKEMVEMMNNQIDAAENFSALQKSEIKTKIPSLLDKIAYRITVIYSKNLDMSNWIKESLSDSLSRQFTAAELQTLINFLKSPQGKVFIEMVKEEANAKIEKRPSRAESLLPEKDAAVINTFFAKPIAAKFVNTFMSDSGSVMNQKIEAWSTSMLKEIDIDVKSGEINKLISDFAKENFN